ncbi:MAG: HIT domain-containing protein [Spirochaetales bacterium]|nr:HIT domain-containing protein [Spirochaetales bacterium]
MRDYFLNFEKYAYVKGPKADGCILCLIRDQDSSVVDLSVYCGKLFVVTVNLYPYNPGHLLIFPKRHLKDVRQYTLEEENRLNELTRYFLDILDEVHRPSGYNIGYNMGRTAGASIEHLHLHVIPRYPNETGIADLLAGKRVLVEEPRETARRIREAIDQEPFSRASS